MIVFDLDGVITSEEAYWDCAGLTLHELLYSSQYWNLGGDTTYRPVASAEESRLLSRATFPEWLILSFKARSLNSNWDTCYAAACLHLVALLACLPDRGANLQPFKPWDAVWLKALRQQHAASIVASLLDIEELHDEWQAQHPFDLPVFHRATGLALFECMDAYASQVLGYSVEGVFSRHRPFWSFCRDLFQEWFLGDALFTRTHGHVSTQTGKPGCIFFETPLLPVEQLRATLADLRQRGYTLGIASGRVKQEASKPLEKYELLHYFDEGHMATYDVVLWGEAELRKVGQQTTLGKPHPFQFMAAVDREAALRTVRDDLDVLGSPFIAVGDSTSDILSGNAAGGLTVAVLTGARSPEARDLLLKSQPDFVIEDITKLPALLDQIDSLALIQQLQFKQITTAEKLLRLWFAKHMELATEKVRLTPKAVSLNSFNGFYQCDGQEYFFKTHVEEHGVLDEYYHSRLLDQAGYNVVRPLQQLREKERQMVIYPVVKWPVMFDLMRAQETGRELPAGITAETLIEAERREDARLLEIYAQTFQSVSIPPLQTPPIHQLFWHRLSGGRFQSFYEGKALPFPATSKRQSLPFEQVQAARWIINGVEQPQTLGQLVQQGKRVLDPSRPTATIVGHGDAHFGNVFLEGAGEETKGTRRRPAPSLHSKNGEASSIVEQMGETRRFLYFDPAFAGRHSPLLDVVKPLFHNVFAMWMYFPDEIARDLRISVKFEGGRMLVEHNYYLTPIRQALLQTKQEHLLQPLLKWLDEQNALPEDWREILNLALMCCPLLTVDLFGQAKRPPEIGWLGLAQAVQLGSGGLEAWKEAEL